MRLVCSDLIVCCNGLSQIYPTVHCLVALEDNPPMVITLDDVEIACLERVQVHYQRPVCFCSCSSAY